MEMTGCVQLLNEFLSNSAGCAVPPRTIKGSSSLPAPYSFLARLPIQHRVNIKNPGYSKKDEDLLTLYAWDHAEGGLQFGLRNCRR
jgi:hypothetical protein